MEFYKLLCWVGFLFLCLISIAGGQELTISTCPSLSDVVRVNQDLTIFASLIENVEDAILRTFEKPAQRVATFAPTDDAWNEFESTGILLSDITSNNTLLNIIIKQHILKTVPQINSLSQISGELETLLEGSPLTTASGLDPETNGQIFVGDDAQNAANVLQVEESCLRRGLVFVVDQVLVPPQVSATLVSIDNEQDNQGQQDNVDTGILVEEDVVPTPDEIIDVEQTTVPKQDQITADEDPIFFNPLLNDQKEAAASTVNQLQDGVNQLQDGEDPIFFNPRLS